MVLRESGACCLTAATVTMHIPLACLRDCPGRMQVKRKPYGFDFSNRRATNSQFTTFQNAEMYSVLRF